MQNEKTNIEHLRAIIQKEMFVKEEALEFLDSIKTEMEQAKSQTNSEISKLEERVEELEMQELGNIIDCGIGTINWDADNIQLEMIMEALEERIKSQGALSVLRKLQMLLPTS